MRGRGRERWKMRGKIESYRQTSTHTVREKEKARDKRVRDTTRAFREFKIPLKKAPLVPLSLSFPIPLPVLAQFYFPFIRKKKGILPGLIAACYELKSNAPSSLQSLTPSPLITFPLFIPPFLPFHTRCSHLAGIFGGNLCM